MSWQQLAAVLQEQAADAAFYRAQEPAACPNDGEPLRPAPEGQPGVTLYCPFDGWAYPRDYNPDIHSGM